MAVARIGFFGSYMKKMGANSARFEYASEGITPLLRRIVVHIELALVKVVCKSKSMKAVFYRNCLSKKAFDRMKHEMDNGF